MIRADRSRSFVPPLIVVSLALSCAACSSSRVAPNEREFEFEYATTLTEIPPDAKMLRVWIPVPSTDEAQTVTDLEIDAPVAHRLGEEKVYGSRLAYLEVEPPFADALHVTLRARILRREVAAVGDLVGPAGEARLLRGDRMAPLDGEAKARALEAVALREGASAKARGIYEKVLADVDYDKSGDGWGRGDLRFVCEEGRGNCSDFHTLFIAMARSQGIPAVFEIGFPLPENAREGTIGGYHCWAWYRDDASGWHPVDASEADKNPARAEYYFGTICANRVAFSRGRDLVLDPPQDGEPLNFLIYPYVEVDGKPGGVQVSNAFRFRDVDER